MLRYEIDDTTTEGEYRSIMICTNTDPWDGNDLMPVDHPDAIEIGRRSKQNGVLTTYECPYCSFRWNVVSAGMALFGDE